MFWSFENNKNHHPECMKTSRTMNEIMIDATTIQRLLAVDTSFITIPCYSKMTKKGRLKT
jgi:hypothetical protein